MNTFSLVFHVYISFHFILYSLLLLAISSHAAELLPIEVVNRGGWVGVKRKFSYIYILMHFYTLPCYLTIICSNFLILIYTNVLIWFNEM